MGMSVLPAWNRSAGQTRLFFFLLCSSVQVFLSCFIPVRERCTCSHGEKLKLLFSSLGRSLVFCEIALGAFLRGCEKEAGKPSLLPDDSSLGFTSAGDAVLSQGHNTSELQEIEHCYSLCARFFLLPKSRTSDKKG